MTYETKLSPNSEPAHPSVDLFNRAKRFVLAPLKRFERDREGQMPKLDSANVEVSIEANDVKANDVADEVKSGVTSSKAKKRRAKSLRTKKRRTKSRAVKAAKVTVKDWGSEVIGNTYNLDQLLRLLKASNLAKCSESDLKWALKRVDALSKGLMSAMAMKIKMRQEAEVQRKISLRAVRAMVRRRELGQL